MGKREHSSVVVLRVRSLPQRSREGLRRNFLHVGGKMGDFDPVCPRQDDGSFDEVSQLSHVPRPGIVS
jgi:hypothetical protein